MEDLLPHLRPLPRPTVYFYPFLTWSHLERKLRTDCSTNHFEKAQPAFDRARPAHWLAPSTGHAKAAPAKARLPPTGFRLDRNRKFSLPLREAAQPEKFELRLPREHPGVSFSVGRAASPGTQAAKGLVIRRGPRRPRPAQAQPAVRSRPVPSRGWRRPWGLRGTHSPGSRSRSRGPSPPS